MFLSDTGCFRRGPSKNKEMSFVTFCRLIFDSYSELLSYQIFLGA